MPTLHAFEFLKQPTASGEGVCALFGDQRFLKQLVLEQLSLAQQEKDADEESGPTLLDGKAEWQDVMDELSTRCLFGPALRLIVVTDADAFVTKHRSLLLPLVERPPKTGTLVLQVETWPASTLLYKGIQKQGLQVDCRLPQASRGKSVDRKQVESWVKARGKDGHQVRLEPAAVSLLWDLAGPELGRVDQELAKLALYVDGKTKATPELVRDVVGGWKTKTTWELSDAAADGKAGEALRQLDHLLASGEHPHALFAQISWSLRRYAAASQIYQQSLRRGRKMPLPEALEQAGFHRWPAGALDDAQRRLKQLGRLRVDKFYRWMLDTDMALKGSHASPSRARWALEHLLLRMASEANPAKAPAAGTRRS